MQNEELQRNQLELELARDRYADLFDFAPVGYFKLDPDGQILQVNLTGSELLGSERAQLRGQDFYHFVTREYRDILFKHLRRVFKNPARQSCEAEILQQEGSSFFAKLDSVEQPDTETDSRQCLTLVTDISRLKKIEAENQRAKEAAENANQAKSHFLAAASHDLRQPLQAMTTITDLLKMKLEGEELFWLVNNLSKSLANMSELFNALLNVSQLESGTIIPEIKEFPVNDLFHHLIKTYRPIAEHKAVKLHVAECSATIRSDPLLLGQILDNLVSNAIRYTESGKVLLGCRHRGQLLRIDVWDTGIGIPEDQQEHIFEEFYQLDNPARDRRKGLGLGLSIVKRISRLLQHEIKQCAWAEGSLFSVEVPLASPVAINQPQANGGSKEGADTSHIPADHR